MASSGKYWRMVSFNCRELARSAPNGFSTITRAPAALPAVAMPWAIRPKRNAGTVTPKISSASTRSPP
jgi:hypothetical protein